MNYPGSKNGSGVYQQIINQLPPHDLYVELFVGSGAVLRKKRPSLASIAVDIDAAAVAALRESPEIVADTTIIHGDVFEWIATYGDSLPSRTAIYADPPYLLESRSAGRTIYSHEFHGEEEHSRLLDALCRLRCYVVVSGYWSQLYMERLKSWRWLTFTAMTRGGPQTEWLWMNYPEPTELHDYRYLGNDYRERERIKRKKERWKARLKTMPAQERYAILAAIQEVWSSSSEVTVSPSGTSSEVAFPADTVRCGVHGQHRQK